MMYEQQQPFHHQLPMTMDMRRKKTTTGKNKGSSAAIEEADQRLQIVDLSAMSFDSLPNPSLNLATICKLDLSNNNLQNIPESLTARLLNVVVLDVHSNQLRSLPNSIGCLYKLKVLNVSGNLIEYLPKTIENCRSLEELNANFNKLIQLPETIGYELKNLKKLSVNSNKLVFLPRSTSQLTALKILDARLNCLRSLPEELENLINLETLNVSQNFQYLDSLPYSVGFLLSLVELDVSYNKIRALPDSIGCLKKLQKISVEGNPLSSPPPGVVEQGLHAVKEYLCQKMNAGHQSPTTNNKKSKSWVGRLVRYGTFNGIGQSRAAAGAREERQAFIVPDYRPIDALASPRYMGMFSPRRLFSPRSYFTN